MNDIELEDMLDKLYGVIFDALKANGIKYDTDCNTIWVDCKDNRTLFFGIEECID